MKIPIDKIIIGPRQREYDPAHGHVLAASMQEVGQIHNIGLSSQPDLFEEPANRGKFLLIYGRHRLEAAKLLGWTEIEAVVRDGLTPQMEQELEYEEDCRRLDRTWQQKCMAVYALKRLKERRTGETWSLRKMEDFTGFGKSQLGYMSQIAQGLNATPRDEELWSCENYSAAIKLLVVRTHAVVNRELERRRSENTQSVVPTVFIGSPDIGKQAVIEAATPLVQTLDTTPIEAPAPTVYIHWRRKEFQDSVPDEDFMVGRAQAVIGYNPKTTCLTNVVLALAPCSFAVAWFDNDNCWGVNQHCQPWNLVWNKLSKVESVWPFSKSYAIAKVIAFKQPNLSSCRASVTTATQDDASTLPSQVVEFSLDGVCAPEMAVLCIGGVRPVHVALTGRTPIFFESDEVVAAKYIAELREHYEETIPGVKVEVRS